MTAINNTDKYKLSINIDKIKKKACTKRYSRGYNLYKKKNVIMCKYSEDLIYGYKKYKFIVKGSKTDDYVVKTHIDIDNNIIYTCSCPDFKYRLSDNGDYCKHCIASILEIS